MIEIKLLATSNCKIEMTLKLVVKNFLNISNVPICILTMVVDYLGYVKRNVVHILHCSST